MNTIEQIKEHLKSEGFTEEEVEEILSKEAIREFFKVALLIKKEDSKVE